MLYLLALLVVLLPVEQNDRVLVRGDVLAELARRPHSVLPKVVLGQDPCSLILLLFLGQDLMISQLDVLVFVITLILLLCALVLDGGLVFYDRRFLKLG